MPIPPPSPASSNPSSPPSTKRCSAASKKLILRSRCAAADYLYYTRTEQGKQYPIQCRRREIRPGDTMENPEEILLDLNDLAQGHGFISLGAFVVSDDQNLLAYTADYTGFRQYTLYVKDLRTGAILPDTAERVTSLVWAPTTPLSS